MTKHKKTHRKHTERISIKQTHKKIHNETYANHKNTDTNNNNAKRNIENIQNIKLQIITTEHTHITKTKHTNTHEHT